MEAPPPDLAGKAHVVAASMGPDPSGREGRELFLAAVAGGATGVVLGGPLTHPTTVLDREANAAGWAFTSSKVDTARCGDPFNQTRWIWCAVRDSPPPPPVLDVLGGTA